MSELSNDKSKELANEEMNELLEYDIVRDDEDLGVIYLEKHTYLEVLSDKLYDEYGL